MAVDLIFFASHDNADSICHGYKLASLNWYCQLLPFSDGEKSDSLMTNFWSFTVAVTKSVQSDRIHMSVGIAVLSHVQARQCTTLSLQNGCVFWSQDAWFHVLMLLSADTMNIFHQRTRLSSPSKQSSNWQHQLRPVSLYSRHIMMSALHHD